MPYLRKSIAYDHDFWCTCINIVCTPLLSAGGGGVEPPTKFSKRGRLDRISILRGGCWERGGESEILSKNFINKNVFL